MGLIKNIFKYDDKTQVALLKQECAFKLWELQEESFYTIVRVYHGGCISEDAFNTLKQEINKFRIGLHDNYLHEKEPKILQKKIQQIEQSFTQFIQVKMSDLHKMEQAIPLEQRLENMNKSFLTLFNQARDDGLIKRDLFAELNMQVQKHREALQESIFDKNIRAEIKQSLIDELVESYYHNVYTIYKEAISKEEGSWGV